MVMIDTKSRLINEAGVLYLVVNNSYIICSICYFLQLCVKLDNTEILLRQLTVPNVLLTTTRVIGVKPAVFTVVLAKLPWQQQLLTLQTVLVSS